MFASSTKKFAACLFAVLFVFNSRGYSQNSQIEKAAKNIEEGAKLVNGIKGLFRKKQKDSVGLSGSNSGPQNEIYEGKDIKMFVGGRITPNTQYLDCDLLEKFNRGAAVIKKGMAQALIDTSGKLILPFNTNVTINSTPNLVHSGFFYASGLYPDEMYVNNKGIPVGKLINKKANEILGVCGDGKLGFSVTGNYSAGTRTIYAFTIDGKKFPPFVLPEEPGKVYSESDSFRDSVFVYRISSPKYGYLYGFVHAVTGFHFKPKYTKLSSFVDGVSCFEITNEFGEKKYGFINKKGEEIFSNRFTFEPSQVFDSIFYVRASSDASFDNALIHVNGTIILKQTRETREQYGDFYSFDDLFAPAGSNLLTRDGKVISKVDFVKSLGIKLGGNNPYSFVEYEREGHFRVDDGYIRFKLHSNSNSNFSSNSATCLFNPKTQNLIIVPQIVDGQSVNVGGIDGLMEFDSVSGLFLVNTLSTQKDRDGKYLRIQGYMNTKGEMVFVKRKKVTDF